MLAEFLEGLDGDACARLYQDAEKTRGEVPCARGFGNCEEADKPPEPHETCQRCWTWRDCTDPACEHPACGHGVSNRFRDTFAERFPDLVAADVLVERSDPVPLIESGRMRILVNEVAPDEKAGAKVLERLLKQRDWQQLYDMPIPAEKHVESEVWLEKQGVAVEVTKARYQTPVWIAMAVGAGQEPRAGGGMLVHEFRLAEALSLEEAPELTQGALF
jgi:hypothetical protein